jgi:hypothetical protein
MSDPATKAVIMHSVGRLVRGLSALFWGLPLSLVIGVQTARTDWLSPFGIGPAVFATSLLYYGLWQLGHFQNQERAWATTLERAKFLAIVNIGLSPFLYWWHRMPQVDYFSQIVSVLSLCSVLFLFNLNQVLQRLSAMLPDETLRYDTHTFTTLNLYLLLSTLFLLALVLAMVQVNSPPQWLLHIRMLLDREYLWFLVLLLLLPVAMTMALLWKTKEVILDSIFGTES